MFLMMIVELPLVRWEIDKAARSDETGEHTADVIC